MKKVDLTSNLLLFPVDEAPSIFPVSEPSIANLAIDTLGGGNSEQPTSELKIGTSDSSYNQDAGFHSVATSNHQAVNHAPMTEHSAIQKTAVAEYQGHTSTTFANHFGIENTQVHSTHSSLTSDSTSIQNTSLSEDYFSLHIPSEHLVENLETTLQTPLSTIEQEVLLNITTTTADSSVDSIIFEVHYHDFTPEAQESFQHAVDVWSQELAPSYEGETIIIDAHWEHLGSRVLGQAGPENFYVLSNDPFGDSSSIDQKVYVPSALADHLVEGAIAPGDTNISASFSCDTNWYYGTDGHTPYGQYDLSSVVMHELGHGLGFISLEKQGFISPYDLNLELGDGTPLISLDSNEITHALTSDDIYWSGQHAVDCNNGVHPKMYAPHKYETGSSISHTDQSNYYGDLMNPQMSHGVSRARPSDIDLGMLDDMGWDINYPNTNPSGNSLEINDILHGDDAISNILNAQLGNESDSSTAIHADAHAVYAIPVVDTIASDLDVSHVHHDMMV